MVYRMGNMRVKKKEELVLSVLMWTLGFLFALLTKVGKSMGFGVQSHFYWINHGNSATLFDQAKVWCLPLENGVDKINLAESWGLKWGQVRNGPHTVPVIYQALSEMEWWWCLGFQHAKSKIPEEHPIDKTSPQMDKGILDCVPYSNYQELLT